MKRLSYLANFSNEDGHALDTIIANDCSCCSYATGNLNG